MTRQENNLYEFGMFRLNAVERLLMRSDEVIPLAPKAIDLLVTLVRNSGHVVTKDELMKQVWPDSYVEEANLSHHIFILRRALGEDKNGLKYIETIPRRGYRFVASVAETGDASNVLVISEHTSSHIVIDEQQIDMVGSTALADQTDQLKPLAESKAANRPSRKLMLTVIAVSLAVIALAIAAYSWMTVQRKREGYGLPVKSIAVLPLKAVGDNPGNSEYLAEGISEALITRLTQLPNLRVIPWVTAGRYKESTKTLQTVADEMRVDALITGSLRRSGDRIVVTVSLIDGQSGLQYWAEEFEEPIADIFTVQRRIALGAARELKGKLSSQQEQTLTQSASRSAQAYEYYLRGKAALRKGGIASKELNQQAFDLFQKALEIDPSLAEA